MRSSGDIVSNYRTGYAARVDSLTVHCLKGRRDEKGNCRGISLSTLDFEGELSVTDPGIFLSALFKGIGPAKAFGCGLMLVRRV